MKMKPKTLRGRFLTILFAAFVIISVISGSIQLYVLDRKMDNDIDGQVAVITEGIQQGIGDTEQAAQEIERQIELRMVTYTKQITNRLDSSLENITNEELVSIRDKLGLAGITVIGENGEDGDLTGLKSTDPQEIGFNFKNIGPDSYENLKKLQENKPIAEDGIMSVIDNIIFTPILQSGSHEAEANYFKYAYYSPEDVSYIVAPYIEADDVNQFTQTVGPDFWIDRMDNENPLAVEMAVLNPRVFADESLAQDFYPPLKKVEYGDFAHQNAQDEEILINMADEAEKVSYIDDSGNGSLYKTFVPVDENRVIYVALDYNLLKAPVVQQSYILLFAGLLSLLILIVLAAVYFNRIYANIQKLKAQMEKLAKGDLTAKSHIKNGGELSQLSESANQMVDTLHHLINNTNAQAVTTQRLSLLLKTEAKESVEKIYTLSMETTAEQREASEVVHSFLDNVEGHLLELNTEESRHTLEKIDTIRKLANDRATTTTDMTITLSDLVQSLYGQSKELSEVSDSLLEHLGEFKIKGGRDENSISADGRKRN